MQQQGYSAQTKTVQGLPAEIRAAPRQRHAEHPVRYLVADPGHPGLRRDSRTGHLGLQLSARIPAILPETADRQHRRARTPAGQVGKPARRVLRFSEAMAVRFADVVIADNKGIQDYVHETYGKEAELIAYGGDHVYREVPQEVQAKHLATYGLTPGQYAITVCRIEPENNCHVTLEAFAHSGKKLVFIGNWDRSAYGRDLKSRYRDDPDILLLDAIYDLDILYSLRANAGIYIHGHSAGGTNPSLVEAMFFGHPIIAYDVVYNRETTRNQAYYFADAESLRKLLARPDLDGAAMKRIAEEEYTWKHISSQYCELY